MADPQRDRCVPSVVTNPISDRFGSTVDLPNVRFKARAVHIGLPPDPPNGSINLISETRILWRVLKAARHSRVLLLYSSKGYTKPEVLACVLFSALPEHRRPLVALYGEMWEPNSGLRNRFDRWAVRRADKTIRRYLLGSEREGESFSRLWNIDPAKIRIRHDYLRAQVAALAAGPPIPSEGYIFAGGDSFRDYGPLLELAERFPNERFVFNTVRLAPAEVPSNVEVHNKRFDGFLDLLVRSDLVIAPLRLDTKRAVGHLTCLTALALRRPLITTPALGIADYVEPETHAIFVDGSVESYTQGIARLRDPDSRRMIEAMTLRAQRHVVEELTEQRHTGVVLRTMDELLAMA